MLNARSLVSHGYHASIFFILINGFAEDGGVLLSGRLISSCHDTVFALRYILTSCLHRLVTERLQWFYLRENFWKRLNLSLKMGSILRIWFVVIGQHALLYVLWTNFLFFTWLWCPSISYGEINESQAIEKIKELAISIEGKSLEEKKSLLAKCAATTLSSKLIGGEKEFFASMVVDAVIAIGVGDRLNMIGIKKVVCVFLEAYHA